MKRTLLFLLISISAFASAQIGPIKVEEKRYDIENLGVNAFLAYDRVEHTYSFGINSSLLNEKSIILKLGAGMEAIQSLDNLATAARSSQGARFTVQNYNFIVNIVQGKDLEHWVHLVKAENTYLQGDFKFDEEAVDRAKYAIIIRENYKLTDVQVVDFAAVETTYPYYIVSITSAKFNLCCKVNLTTSKSISSLYPNFKEGRVWGRTDYVNTLRYFESNLLRDYNSQSRQLLRYVCEQQTEAPAASGSPAGTSK